MSESSTSRFTSLLRAALRLGWRSGLVLGGVWVAYDLINNLGALDAAGYGRLNHGLLVALVAVYLWAGSRTAYRSGRIQTGVLAVAGASLIGSVIAITSLWIVTYLFLDIIRHNPYMIEDFHRSGMHDMDAFIVDDNLVPTFVGPWFSLALAAAVGSIGAVIGKGLSGPGAGLSSSERRNVAMRRSFEGFERITVDPAILGGKPCIRGMRLSVQRVLEILACNASWDDLRQDYPELEVEDIRQALAFAAA